MNEIKVHTIVRNTEKKIKEKIENKNSKCM